MAREPGDRAADAGDAGGPAARPAPGCCSSPSTTASVRSCTCRLPAAETAFASGRGSATKRPPSSPRSCARSRASAGLRAPLLIDAEIVALDEKGRPAGFQRLQGRIHLKGARDVEQIDKAQPVAIIAFDLLRDGDDDIRGLPLTERRARLEAHLGRHLSTTIRISEQVAGDGRALHERARAKDGKD